MSSVAGSSPCIHVFPLNKQWQATLQRTPLAETSPVQIEMLTYLAGVTKGPVQKLEVLINVITVTFDMNQPTQVGLWVSSRPGGGRIPATCIECTSHARVLVQCCTCLPN